METKPPGIFIEERSGYNIFQPEPVILTEEEIPRAKRIIILGESGSGKTTMINAIANYFHGVQFKDNFRYKLDFSKEKTSQSKAQTKTVTQYQFRIPLRDESIIIIDTPGFNDPEGFMRDQDIKKEIFEYLQNESYTINAICFVLKNTATRINDALKHVVYNLMEGFGIDVKNNIFLFLTFSDSKNNSALEAIKASKIVYSKDFHFNNVALMPEENEKLDTQETEDSEKDSELKEIFFNRTYKSLEKFLKALFEIKPITLSKTKEVIDLRIKLENLIGRLSKEIECKIICLNNLIAEQKAVEEQKELIDNKASYNF